MKLVYKPKAEDPQETKVFDVVFRAGEPVEIPPGREWLGWKLKANPWFEVVEDAADHSRDFEGSDGGPLPSEQKPEGESLH